MKHVSRQTLHSRFIFILTHFIQRAHENQYGEFYKSVKSSKDLGSISFVNGKFNAENAIF
jgi:hypothetical protein